MTPRDKPTCGPLYKAALDHYAGADETAVRIFAAGFVNGQAEKIYLGACRAAMFCPSPERREMVLGVAEDVAQRYGLFVIPAEGEIWLVRDQESVRQVKEMLLRRRNSPGYHRLRGLLCGVPLGEVDETFHERRGHGEKCD